MCFFFYKVDKNLYVDNEVVFAKFANTTKYGSIEGKSYVG